MGTARAAAQTQPARIDALRARPGTAWEATQADVAKAMGAQRTARTAVRKPGAAWRGKHPRPDGHFDPVGTSTKASDQPAPLVCAPCAPCTPCAFAVPTAQGA